MLLGVTVVIEVFDLILMSASVKLGRISVGSVKLAKSGIDDLLSSTEGGKHDYDWYLLLLNLLTDSIILDAFFFLLWNLLLLTLSFINYQ